LSGPDPTAARPAGADAAAAARLRAMLDELAPIGRDPATGGYRRFGWTAAELACREWFSGQAAARGMSCEADGNGNLWAWWGDPAEGAVVTGSHLDSVPDGGAFDGPLGVVSAFCAVDELRARGIRPARPLAVVAFAEEEGSRFGVACLGTRLLTGAIDPALALARTDSAGTSLAAAMRAAGADPAGVGPDPVRLSQISAFVELHIEQGRWLAEVGAPVGLASGIWPHGRWRYRFAGQANHAGTTRLADRRDPMLTFANTVLAARKKARQAGALATFGRVSAGPNATNAVAGTVDGWLDARAPDRDTLDGLVAAVERAAAERGQRDGVQVAVTAESVSPGVTFDPRLRQGLQAALGGLPELATGAGHDAGVLAGHLPAAMLFVRNPTGVSHSPFEHADDADCAAGVLALADALAALTA
jgi:beta-ureidopropionase / N-carbamoyl-L-amino-acid hydrolase